MKTLVNGRRVPLLPPIQIGDKFITNFTEKAEALNYYFAKQCRVIDNNSQLPDRANFAQINDYIKFANVNILKILNYLDINKAIVHDNLSISVIKLSSKPFELIFRNFERRQVSFFMEKANIVPIHKNNEKNLVINYRPVSLLSICRRLFERFIHSSIYKFLSNNNLPSQNQSGFRSADSFINQLISITHDIFHWFESYELLEV